MVGSKRTVWPAVLVSIGAIMIIAGGIVLRAGNLFGANGAAFASATLSAPVESSSVQTTGTPVSTLPGAAEEVLPPRSDLFSGELAFAHAEAQMAIGPRVTGTPGAHLTAEYITETLSEHGWQTETRTFTYQGVEGRNLVGRAGAAGGPVYLLGAHYDTRRRADRDTAQADEPVPGANDGASGVAVLLELARVLDLDAIDGEVWLVFFDAEDNGHLDGWEYIAGSREFVSTLEITPVFAIIVDMVGDADQNIYYEQNSDIGIMTQLWQIAADLGYSDYFIPEYRHSMLDDHTAFLEQGIRAVDIIDFDYGYWHTTQDTLDKINPASLERVGRILEVFLETGLSSYAR